MTVLSWLVTGILIAWLALTVIVSCIPRTARSRLRALEWMLPEWRFFAPNPGIDDYYVWVRQRMDNGSVTDKRTVSAPRSTRSPLVFNVSARRRNLRRNIVDGLFLVSRLQAPERIVDSAAYATLYTGAADFLRRDAGRTGAFQFGVDVVHARARARETVFASLWHDLDVSNVE